MFTKRDFFWMQQAIRLAKTAGDSEEVPIGAVLVADDCLLGEGANSPIKDHDPTAHAEILALRSAGKKLENYRFLNTTLYTTLEPCVMCIGAIVHARVKRVVYGASDPKAGALDSVLRLGNAPHFNHSVEYEGGLLAEECGHLLRQFFQERRRE